MAIVLNTVAVSAAVDPTGAITHWFDKESGNRILASPWREEVDGVPLQWLVRAGSPRVVHCSGPDGSKTIRATFRGMIVDYDMKPVVRSVLDLHGELVSTSGDGAEIGLHRAVVSVSISGSATCAVADDGLEVSGGGQFVVDVQVNDLAAS